MESTTNMAQQQQQQKREKEETELTVPISSSSSCARSSSSQISDPNLPSSVDLRVRSATSPEKPSPDPTATTNSSKKRQREVNRCSGSGCRKRIGLVGFRCRCGDTFCSEHRYSDRHVCSYDYKAAGREAIQKENPVVRASKLLKV